MSNTPKQSTVTRRGFVGAAGAVAAFQIVPSRVLGLNGKPSSSLRDEGFTMANVWEQQSLSKVFGTWSRAVWLRLRF